MKRFSSRLRKTIKPTSRIVIGTHIDPDSDGICTALGCASLLERSLGAKPALYCNSPIPPKYDFLLKNRKFLNGLPAFDVLVAVDSADLTRVVPPDELAGIDRRAKIVINIDHHASNTHFGDLNYVDPRVSSACEIVYRLFRERCLKLTLAEAEILYAGLYVETGGFAFANTTRDALNVASELVNIGVAPALLIKKLQVRTFPGTKLLSAVLDTVKVKNGIGTMRLTEDMIKKTGAQTTDSEHFISFLQAISGVRVSLFFRQEKDCTRVSLRSDGSVDVNRVARRFGGGGHKVAAGARVAKNVRAAEKLVVSAVRAAGRKTWSQ